MLVLIVYYHHHFHATSQIVNECESDNGGCDQICTDTLRSFSCNCSDGYLLDEDDRSCIGKHLIIFGR